MICSHGNARALANSSRAVPDNIIEAIAGHRGGGGHRRHQTITSCGGKRWLTWPEARSAPWMTFLEHAEYMRDLVGIEHVGLGPDFMHGARGS